MAMTGTTSGTLPHARTRAIVSARRHSVLVRVLRIALPVGALALTVGVIGSIVSDPRVLLAAQLDAEDVGVSGSRIVMQRPRLTGYSSSTGEPKPYEIIAERAEQNIAKPNEVALHELKAKISMRENGWAELLAASGHMDSNTQILELYESIEVTTDLKDRARLSEAVVDLRKAEIVSPAPVDIKMGSAVITSDHMQLFQTGQRAVFTGRVRMVLYPENARPDGDVQ